jgi:hypothetical protein
MRSLGKAWEIHDFYLAQGEAPEWHRYWRDLYGFLMEYFTSATPGNGLE